MHHGVYIEESVYTEAIEVVSPLKENTVTLQHVYIMLCHLPHF